MRNQIQEQASSQGEKSQEANSPEAQVAHKDILEYVPAGYKLRPVQIEALRELQKAWRQADVFVLNLPVAAGKSIIAQVISRWSSSKAGAGPAITLASNNMLVKQYLESFPRLPVLHGMSQYFCSTSRMNLEKKYRRKIPRCSPELGCAGCDARRLDERRIHVVPYALVNYYTYLAHKLYKRFKVLVVDEAHSLISVLQEMSSSKVWYHKLPAENKYPLEVTSVMQLREWADTLPDYLLKDEDGEDTYLAKFKRAAYSGKYIFKSGEEEYEGELKHCIRLMPIDLTEEPALFFPSGIRKIILMSGTISSKDVEQLGLYRRHVRYIEATSPIPADRRPVYLARNGVSMAYARQRENLPELINLIEHIVNSNPEHKGLIHAPYSLARTLASSSLRENPRYLFHGKANKGNVYQEFRNSKEPLVLIASGMAEGVDLPYDAGRFQIISKIPFPSLADPAIKFKAERDRDWYAWETIKLVQQAAGRICRGPDDYGETIVLDRDFMRLYLSNRDMFPIWWHQAVRWVSI